MNVELTLKTKLTLDKQQLREMIESLFIKHQPMIAPEIKAPKGSKGDYSLTGKIIALAEMDILSKYTALGYRDAFESAIQ